MLSHTSMPPNQQRLVRTLLWELQALKHLAPAGAALVQRGPWTLRPPCYCGVLGRQPSPALLSERLGSVVVDGYVFVRASGRDLVLSAFASLPGDVPSLDKNRSDPGSGEPQRSHQSRVSQLRDWS